MRSLIGKFSIVVVGLLGISGCNFKIAEIHVPVLVPLSQHQTQPQNLGKADFAFVAFRNGIRRTDKVLVYPWYRMKNGHICNLGRQLELTAAAARDYLGSWSEDALEVVFETMTNAGYEMRGDPSDFFSREDGMRSARYSVAARLTDLKGDICKIHDGWSGHYFGNDIGRLYVRVEWVVKDNLKDQVVFKRATEGYHNETTPSPDGLGLLLQSAIADATERLAITSEFVKLSNIDEGVSLNDLTENMPGERITFKNGRSFEEFNYENLIENVVTIRFGNSHGSGFFIGDEGYILTNAHVVGDANTVNIGLTGGFSIPGEVVVKNDVRDVALVKVPMKPATVLRINPELPKPASGVYVIGTPRRTDLSGTVTSGIVSSVRTFQGLNYIQADASITGGNSGGPLFNEEGEVIGLTVANIVNSNDVNLFIPIAEAMTILNLRAVASN